jgi:hypothetical protein
MSIMENDSIASKAPIVQLCLGILLLLIVLRVCLCIFFLVLTCKEAHEKKEQVVCIAELPKVDTEADFVQNDGN